MKVASEGPPTIRRRSSESVPGFEPDALRRLRQARGLSHDALGARAGISRPNLIAVEKGRRRPGAETVIALALSLDVSPGELLAPPLGPPSLADLRIRAGLTRTALAARLELARSTWGLIEDGHRSLTARVAAATADWLGVAVDEVVTAWQRASRAPLGTRPAGQRRPPRGLAGTEGLSREGSSGGVSAHIEALPLSADNLPLAADGFVGRERHLADLVHLIGDSRLVTLTGPPGVGKTRLALELARRLRRRYPKGTWLIDIAPVSDGALVKDVVAASLGVREQPGTGLIEALVSQIREQRVLLVLDNCEHVREASAELVAQLLDGSPNVTVLATSQAPLDVPGERPWPVEPLSVPSRSSQSLDEIRSGDAVRLFCQRASTVRRDFRLTEANAGHVADICRRLDGIPLAIELAAARIGLLTPAEIGSRLDNRLLPLGTERSSGPARHRTMGAAIGWSYQLLSERERALLRRLSVFSGGCGLGALEAVCSDPPGDLSSILEPLDSLVAKSLVLSDTAGVRARYRVLETIRLFGLDRLADQDEVTLLRHRHAIWCLSEAEGAQPALTCGDPQPSLDRLQAERDNIRAALAWTTGAQRGEQALRLSTALTMEWRLSGRFTEGRSWLQRALDISDGVASDLRARGFWGLGFLTLMLEDHAAAVPALEQGLALFRATEDRQGIGRSLLLLGNCALHRDPPAGLSLLKDGLALARETGDSWCVGHSLVLLGLIHTNLGDVSRARPLLEEALLLGGRPNEQQHRRLGLLVLGKLNLWTGDLVAAGALLHEGLLLAEELREPYATAVATAWLGELALARGDRRAGRRLFNQSLEIGRRLENPGALAEAWRGLGMVALLSGDLPGAHAHLDTALSLVARGGATADATLIAMGQADLTGHDIDSARSRFCEAIASAEGRGDRRLVAQGLHHLGSMAHAIGDDGEAAQRHHQALELRRQIEDAPGMASSLESLAGLMADAGQWVPATRLLAAADAAREANGWARPPLERRRLRADIAAIRAGTTRQIFHDAWAEGTAMSLWEAAAQATKGRGRRRRPPTGWASLTNMEREVTGLVSEALTNDEIAERLFISPRTVESHLTHIFAKLGVRSRLGLARQAAASRS